MAIGDKSHEIEINDSELEREGWKRGRYKGTKLTAAKINKFTDGDISYGTDPVIEQFSKTVYVFSRAINSFEATLNTFYPSTDEFNQLLENKSIVGSTSFTLDRAVTFNLDDPTDFSQIDITTNDFKSVSRNSIDSDLALFSSCSVKFFNNVNNAFVKDSYTVGYNRGEFIPAAIYFQSESFGNVSATENDTKFQYGLDTDGRLYINPNVEEWFIAQDGASGSLGSVAQNVALTIDHVGDKNQVNSVEGYFFQLSKRLGPTSTKNERYYISFNQGKSGGGNLEQKNLLKAYDVHELAPSGSNIDLENNHFNIVTSGRFGFPFTANYTEVNTQEFVLFKEQKRSNTIHLDFNIITEAPGGVGNGGVIIPDNLHPVIKERLNVFLSNAGLGAEGGTSANFNFGSVRAVRKDQDIFGKQNILAPEDQSIKSTINTTGFSPLDDEEDQFKSFGDLFGGG